MVWAEVEAVVGGILRDQIDFADPFGDQPFGFLNDIGLGAGSMGSAHFGDGAEATGVIAAFCDLEVSKVAGGKSVAWSVVLRDIIWAYVDIDDWSDCWRERGEDLPGLVVEWATLERKGWIVLRWVGLVVEGQG